MKKTLTVIMCFIAVLTASLDFTKGGYTVSASTIMDYNLVNIPDHTVIINNKYFIDTNYGLILLPNVEYKLTFDYNIIETDAHYFRCSVGYGSNYLLKDIASTKSYYTSVSQGTVELVFTTPSTFNIENPILFVREVRNYDYLHTSTVEISNIKVQFVDETLGAIYLSGYYEGAKPYEENWEVYYFEDDSLSDRCWKIYEYTSEYTGLKVNYHRSSVAFTLPLGYYRVEQKFLDLEEAWNRPKFYDPNGFYLERDFPPIAYLDKSSEWGIHLPINIIGDLNNDRYIYFSVPYDNCQVRFQFVTSFYEDWDDSINSLYQLIELSFDANFESRYYDIYERGYNNGKTDGYSEGKSDGLLTGYNNGYADGYSKGKNEGLSTGYNNGYTDGYNIGFNEGSSSSITTSWFTSFINSIFNIFNVEIFPNVKLIYLIFIPVGLGVLALIFKLIRG